MTDVTKPVPQSVQNWRGNVPNGAGNRPAITSPLHSGSWRDAVYTTPHLKTHDVRPTYDEANPAFVQKPAA